MKRVLLDVDGVCGDLVSHLLNRLHQKYPGLKIPDYEEFKEYRLTMNTVDDDTVAAMLDILSLPGFARDMPVIDGAVDGILFLRSCGYEITFVTAPFYDNPTWVFDRYRWLSENFGVTQDEMIFTDAKYLVLGDYLVDDSPFNIRACVEHNKISCKGIVPLVFDQPWNRGKVPDARRVCGWDDLSDVLAFDGGSWCV